MTLQNIPGRWAMAWIIDSALTAAPPNAVWVEVGVALGKGLSNMARRLLDAGRHDVKLYAVDPWAGTARNGEQSDLAEKHGGDWALFLDMMHGNARAELNRVHIIRAGSVEAARVFDDETVDLCILDADHTLEAVRADIGAWLPKVKIGGVIGGDDHHAEQFPGVIQACKERFGDDYTVREDDTWKWPTWRHVKAQSTRRGRK